jgi:phospholipid/cholesterol/gamma-HCH transport system substrate-binding protein
VPGIPRLIRILIATGIAGALAGGAMWLQQEFTATRDAALYRAIFYDAGGLQAGADVVEKGAIVGEVYKVELFNGNALVVFSVDGVAHLGATTTASIRPETPSSPTALEVQSRGTGILQPGETIPLERTTSFSPSWGAPDLSTTAQRLPADTIDTEPPRLCAFPIGRNETASLAC